MEKKVAHYSLQKIVSLIQVGNYHITQLAKDNAEMDFDFDDEDIINVVTDLEQSDLWKSMTSDQDYRIWQDVYHYRFQSGETVYIKLQIVDDNTVVIQFKRK